MPRKTRQNPKDERSSIFQYPDPEQPEDLVRLADLEEPDKNFTDGWPDKAESRKTKWFNIEMGKELIKFHFWGFNLDGVPLKNAVQKVHAFRKLAFNQDEQHRSTNYKEFLDLRRDAGPRLLKPHLLGPTIRPISRRYPTVQSDQSSYDEQWKKSSLPETRREDEPDEPSSGDPVPSSESGPAELSALQTEQLRAVREGLEKTLIAIAYKPLDVTPKGDSNQALTTLYGEYATWERSFHYPLRIALERCRWDIFRFPNAHAPSLPYSCRGRGPPALRANQKLKTTDLDPTFSAIDCIVMAAKFLDAGLTNLDCEGMAAIDSRPDYHQMFTRMVSTDWNLFPPEYIRSQVDQFIRAQNIVPGMENWQVIFDICTQYCRQFQFNYTSKGKCATCIDTITEVPLSSQYVCAKVNDPNITMEEVLNQAISQARVVNTCQGCQGALVEQTTSVQELPWRLAVHLTGRPSPKNHTSTSIKIRYTDTSGKGQTAVYRWLGGIYGNMEEDYAGVADFEHGFGEKPLRRRYRVYWTEHIRGERPTSRLRLYDGMNINGIVVGDISPDNVEEPIPAEWWQGKYTPCLFYERVVNPDRLTLDLSLAIIGDMLQAHNDDVVILEPHEPWTAAQPVLQPRDGDVEKRLGSDRAREIRSKGHWIGASPPGGLDQGHDDQESSEVGSDRESGEDGGAENGPDEGQVPTHNNNLIMSEADRRQAGPPNFNGGLQAESQIQNPHPVAPYADPQQSYNLVLDQQYAANATFPHHAPDLGMGNVYNDGYAHNFQGLSSDFSANPNFPVATTNFQMGISNDNLQGLPSISEEVGEWGTTGGFSGAVSNLDTPNYQSQVLPYSNIAANFGPQVNAHHHASQLEQLAGGDFERRWVKYTSAVHSAETPRSQRTFVNTLIPNPFPGHAGPNPEWNPEIMQQVPQPPQSRRKRRHGGAELTAAAPRKKVSRKNA
jgi:hypothetical protein